MKQGIRVGLSLACLILAASRGFGQGSDWSLWQPAAAACPQCGASSCNGLACCRPTSAGLRAPRLPQVRPSAGLRIGKGGFPDNKVSGFALPGDCLCGGAGCELCRRTGPMHPGYLRAAAFGWINPNGCAGCQPNGYPPGASAYPFPWDGQIATECQIGYQNLGDTCCGPYWYDFLVEGVMLTRTGQGEQGLISDRIRGLGPPNLVLTSNSADFDFEPGFRFTGRYQCDAVYNLEATYLGGLTWSDSAFATSGNNGLFSVFSDFGNTPLGGFAETDQASQARVDIEGELDSVEVSYRRSWISPDYRVNGSWFIGARYIRFEDILRLGITISPHTNPFPDPPVMVPAGFSQYDITATNDLVGPQIGTSLVHCLFPGVMLGGEAKTGIYGNGVDQNSVFNASTLANPFVETISDTQLAYASEGRAYLIWQFHPLAKLRVGYEVLFLDGIATASGNFNTVAPLSGGGLRTAFLNHDDQSLFHGGHIGFELGW